MRYIPLLICLLLISCAPSVRTRLSDKKSPALAYDAPVTLLGVRDKVPSGSVFLGTVRVGDKGFTVNCEWDVMMTLAKAQARRAGANVLKIIKHMPAGVGSNCDRFTLEMYKSDQDALTTQLEKSEAMVGSDYALLHVYRPSGYGILLGYDLHFGDSVICRAKDNSAYTIKLTKRGPNIIWAKTEVLVEEAIDVEFGKEYYLRCSLIPGILMGRPFFRWVEKDRARVEIQEVRQ